MQLEDRVDAAFICLPRDLVLQAVRDCVSAKVGGLIVISAGFGEGDDAGVELESRIREITVLHDLPTVGPNTIGYVNRHAKLMGSFVNFGHWIDGNVAIVAQTGIYAGALTQQVMMQRSQRFGIGISIDLGNRVGLSEIDLMKVLATDETIDVLGFHLEEFVDLYEFLRHAGEVAADKPVVLLKSGRTSPGARAVAAHTGTSTSEVMGLEFLLAQHGVVSARDHEDFVMRLNSLSCYVNGAGRRIGVATYSGALGVTAIDTAIDAGLEIAELGVDTSSLVGGFFPTWQTVGNPIDLWSASEVGDPKTVASACFRALASDPGVDQVYLILLASDAVDFPGYRELLEVLRKESPGVPIHISVYGGNRQEWVDRFDGLGVLVHDSAEIAARSIVCLAEFAEGTSAARPGAGPVGCTIFPQ